MAAVGASRIRLFIIDTSALMDIGTLPNPEQAHDIIGSAVDAGTLVIPREAWVELKRLDPECYQRYKPRASSFVLPLTDGSVLLEAGRLQLTYRQMCQPLYYSGQGDKADPYLIAQAILNGYVVVSNEANRRQRIPVVCRHEGIECINLQQLLQELAT